MNVSQLAVEQLPFSGVPAGAVFQTADNAAAWYLKTNLSPGVSGEAVAVANGAALAFAADRACVLVPASLVVAQA
jgi:hypothetical protein